MKSDINKIEIGRRIAEIRKQNGYTQEKLADALDLTPKHICHCEAGTSFLSLDVLISFCSLCNCSMDYIIWGRNNDTCLDSIHPDIISILRAGTDLEKEMLNRYLEMFVELRKKQET